jgi:choline kinase
MYKVLITTSGTGSRLKELTKDTNKALIPLMGKKIIDFIIEKYPEEIELILTVGYKGELVKNYVKKKYPTRNITFVTIDLFEGPGSSLGYSMLQAKELLQCPFIFHCNDTIVLDQIPSPSNYNWNGGAKGNNPHIFNTTHYASFNVKNGNMESIQPKGASSFDYFHIGLAGFKDYQEFWSKLESEYKQNSNDSALNDVAAINQMLQKNIPFKAVEFKNWYDTGNLDGFNNAKKTLTKI